MKRQIVRLLIITMVAAALVVCTAIDSVVAKDNWPQWRGADQTSVSKEAGLPDQLNQSNLLWETELPGPGGSSPVVWADRVFVTTVDGNGLSLVCIGIDGKTRWKRQLEGENVNIRMDQANSASPSPITDGANVWAMMTNGILHCFTIDGELKWKKDLQREYGKFEIQFGMTSTPLLDNGRIYLQFIHGNMRDKSTSRGTIAALDAQTGNEIWTHVRSTPATMENKHSYASPIMYRNGDEAFLISHGGDYAIGHQLADGAEIWRCGGLNPEDSYNPFLRFVSSPVCAPDLIVVPSAKNGPVLGLKTKLAGDVTGKSDAIRWQVKAGTPDVASPVIYKGLVYLARENGTVICVDANTGEEVYSKRLLDDRHRATPVAADNKLYLVSRKGNVMVVKAGREFDVLSEYDLNEDATASPAISSGVVYIRTSRALYAFGRLQDSNDEESEQMKGNQVGGPSRTLQFAIAIHGGAGPGPQSYSNEINQQQQAGLTHALELGVDILKQGGTALDVVEKVVRYLEDDPHFNAGKGAVFNSAGGHELDASIMDGKSKACGAVAGVTRVKNPISLARLVMTETRHVLLIADGAEVFAEKMGIERVEPEYFDTPATVEAFKKLQRGNGQRNDQGLRKLQPAIRADETGWYYGTVGCVALDSFGNLAAATSTGGVPNKQYGRVGDSPIVGAGTYADNATCAVSCTGIGEQFIRNAVAYDVSAQIAYRNMTVAQSVGEIIKHKLKQGDGGIIAISRDGSITIQYNTPGMARAAADSKGRFEVVWIDQQQESETR